MKFPRCLGIFTLFFLVSCGFSLKRFPSHELNYLGQDCQPSPRLNVLLAPLSAEALENRKALFAYYFPKGWTDKEQYDRLVHYIYQAFLKERAFQALGWRGVFSFTVEEEAKRKGLLLVIVEEISLYPPTKVTPGKVGFSVRVWEPRGRYSLWRLTIERDLCPSYPRDSYFKLSRGSPPHGDLSCWRYALFELARLAARQIKAPSLEF